MALYILMNLTKLANFFFELGMMKREKHQGFAIAGVHHDMGSLADHTCRAALIGAILAEMEGADVNKVAMMVLLHDIPETRIGDHHKVAARYLDTKKVERAIFLEQIQFLPDPLQKKWLALYDEKAKRSTKEGIIAKDADWLELAGSAREYIHIGYTDLQLWVDNVRTALETESAKRLLAEIERQGTYDWARGLEKMTYKKLL